MLYYFVTSPLLNLCHLQMTQQLAQSSSGRGPVNESIHSKEPAKMKFWNQRLYMQTRHTVPPFPIKSPFAKLCKTNRNYPNLYNLFGSWPHRRKLTFWHWCFCEMTKTCLSGFPQCSVRTHICLLTFQLYHTNMQFLHCFEKIGHSSFVSQSRVGISHGVLDQKSFLSNSVKTLVL